MKPFVVESVSMLNAIQRLEDGVFQSMIIGTVKVIIISARAAEDDCLDLLTVFLRQPMVSLQTLVICSKDKPEDLIGFEAPFGIQPGLIIGKQQLSALKLVHSFPVELWDFIARVDNRTTDPFLPVIKLDRENKSYLLEGIEVFKGAKPVGTFNTAESYIFGVLTGKTEEAYREITVEQKTVGFSKVDYRSKIRIIKGRKQPRIQVAINAQGTLLDIPERFSSRVATYRLFRKEMEKQLRKEVLRVVKKMQALNIDPVGFRKHLEVAGVKNWEEIYPGIPVEVKVNFRYRDLPLVF